MVRASISAAIFAASLASLAAPAVAQSPMPIGNWQTADKSEGLVIQSNGTCGFFFKGRLNRAGTCYWDASYAGGILDLVYPMPLEPGHIRWSVIWVNAKTIKVDGDVFHKLR